MAVSFSINGALYEAVDPTTENTVEKDREQNFNGRFDIERFVDDMFDHNLFPLALFEPLLSGQLLTVTDEKTLKQGLCEAIEKQQLVIQYQPVVSGAPNAPSVTEQQDLADEAGISRLYSPEMRRFVLENQSYSSSDESGSAEYLQPSSNTLQTGQVSGPSSGSTSTTTAAANEQSSPSPESTHKYKIVVEIAGRNACKKHTVEINKLGQDTTNMPIGLQPQREQADNDYKARHRSLIPFKKLPNQPRDLSLKIATKGHGADISLPLIQGISPVDQNTEKPEWETILVPVKPLIYITPEQKTSEADVLAPGWIYIFWQGKLWRELQVLKTQALKDVNVDYYRNNWNGSFGQKLEREAEGHATLSPWIPYKLNGTVQSGANMPRMAFSKDQWDWPYIEELEGDAAKRDKATTPLDVSKYSQEQHFKNAPAPLGSVEIALKDQAIDAAALGYKIRSEQGKILNGYRNSLMPVVYLTDHDAVFRMKLQNRKGKALGNKPIKVTLGGTVYESVTDLQGIIEIELDDEPMEDCTLNGDVAVWLKPENKTNNKPPKKIKTFSTQVQTLPDVSTVKGQQLRLNNLSFDAGVVDGINGRRTKGAIRAFQTNAKIQVDGICGPISQRKLQQAHKR